MADTSQAEVSRVQLTREYITYTIRLLLFLVGYVWMLTLPSSLHGQRTYIDENALQPGQARQFPLRVLQHTETLQVSTYWNWGEVHKADRYLDQLELLRDRNASSHE